MGEGGPSSKQRSPGGSALLTTDSQHRGRVFTPEFKVSGGSAIGGLRVLCYLNFQPQPASHRKPASRTCISVGSAEHADDDLHGVKP